MQGHEQVVEWLLASGAGVSMWGAHQAASQGDLGMLQRLMDNGWDVNTLCKVRRLSFLLFSGLD